MVHNMKVNINRVKKMDKGDLFGQMVQNMKDNSLIIILKIMEHTHGKDLSKNTLFIYFFNFFL